MASFSIPLTGLECRFDRPEYDCERSVEHEYDGLQGADDQIFPISFINRSAPPAPVIPFRWARVYRWPRMRRTTRKASINSTGNATDVALNGNGFFVIGNGPGGYELHARRRLHAGGEWQSITSDWHERHGLSGGERSGQHGSAADGDQHSGRRGAGTESNRNDEHDGEPGFGNSHRHAVSRGGHGVRLSRPGAYRDRELYGRRQQHVELLGYIAGGGLFASTPLHLSQER